MTTLNGCHDRPGATAATTLVAQSGWRDARDGFGNPVRIPVYVDIPYAMSTECQYSKTTPDPRCAGCKHDQGAV